MRAKWMLLTKIQLMGLLGLNRARNTSDARVRRRAVGGAVAFAVVSLLLIAYVTLFAVVFCGLGLTQAVPAAAIALTAIITFFFSLLQGGSILFALKDYDAVMSLPVSKRAVIGSRLLVSYLVNLLFCLTLCAPLLPVVVATAIGTLLTALMAGLRIKGLLQGLFGVLFFAAIMVLSFAFSFSMQSPDAAGNMAAAVDALARYVYPPAQWISMTLSGEAVWGIFAFVGVSVAAAALFVLAVSPFYSKINAALLNRGARVAYKAGDVKSASAFASLLGKEFRRLFTSSVYLLNGISGVLLLVLGGVALLFVDVQAFIDLLRAEAETEAPYLVEFFEQNLPYMAAGLVVFFIGMSCPAASALSLEGSSRGLLMSRPVSARTSLLAKAMPTFRLDGAASLFFSAVVCAKVGAGASGWAALLSTAVIFSAFTALCGIFLNYKLPKYDWKAEANVVKSSAPVTILVLGAMVVGFLLIGLSFLGWYAVAAFNAVCIVLCVAWIAYFKGARLYAG